MKKLTDDQNQHEYMRLVAKMRGLKVNIAFPLVADLFIISTSFPPQMELLANVLSQQLMKPSRVFVSQTYVTLIGRFRAKKPVHASN